MSFPIILPNNLLWLETQPRRQPTFQPRVSQFFSQEPAKPDKPYWLVVWLESWLVLSSWLSVGWLT
jgi:hypothetical protein